MTLYTCVRLLMFLYRQKSNHFSDGWRKTTEVHHRTEQSKYIGSILNLAVCPEDSENERSFFDRVIAHLREVFKETPDTHFSLSWSRFAVKRVVNNFIDFTRISFLKNGAISNMIFYPGTDFPLPPAQESNLQEIIIIIQDSYNLTKDLPDKRRPLALWKMVLDKIAGNSSKNKNPEIIHLAQRILGSTWINFLDVGADQGLRKQPHWFYNQKNSGFGIINIHCRYGSEFNWTDLWLQISHTGMDGRAGAKLQSRIKRKMGIFNEAMKFPRDFSVPGEFAYFRVPGQNVFTGSGFTDFTDVIRETSALAPEYGKILPIAILIWGLATRPPFRGKKFNIPVDVPANETHDRTVGFVFTKPKYFMDHFPGKEAFRKYLDDFNEQVIGARYRSALNYYFLESSLMVPHWILILMLKFMKPSLHALTGSVCVTIIEGL